MVRVLVEPLNAPFGPNSSGFSQLPAAVRAPTLPLVRLLDVFAGAGGLSLGLAAAGFDVVAAVERDADAGATFARTHPAADLYGRDLNGLSLRHLRGQVDVVAGGPPCQPWSTGGKRLGAEDPRDGWPGFLRVLAETAPAAFVAENVAGMAAMPRSGRYRALLRELEGLGFTVAAQVVDAADLGVPSIGAGCSSSAREDRRSPSLPRPTARGGRRRGVRRRLCSG